MKKFKCIVTRVDEYEIEIDEAKINAEWMECFRSYMYSSFIEYKDHAEHLAQLRARIGEGFYEGYGVPLVNGEVPLYGKVNKETIQDGINIKVISEDNDCEVEVEEL